MCGFLLFAVCQSQVEAPKIAAEIEIKQRQKTNGLGTRRKGQQVRVAAMKQISFDNGVYILLPDDVRADMAKPVVTTPEK